MIRDILPEYDSTGVIFDVCRGAFVDEAWFRSRMDLVADPTNRARHIDFSSDWWYVDDLAQHYMELAGLGMEFMSHQGRRICAPDPHGDGLDMLEWLNERVVS
jgi:hypothetical protein